MKQQSIIVVFTELHELRPTELASMSQSEIQRADRCKTLQRRQQFLCARALLRALLERHTGNPSRLHELITDDNGKPHCVAGPAVSIAHSDNLVVCAVTDEGQIGIDVEAPAGRRNTRGIADGFFSSDEALWLAAQPDDRFYMLWVLKEAWLKATGKGIAGGLNCLRCIVTPPHIEADVADGGLKALSLYAVGGALAGLATTETPHDNAVVERWDSSASRFEAHSGVRLIAATDSDRVLDPAAPGLPTQPVLQPASPK